MAATSGPDVAPASSIEPAQAPAAATPLFGNRNYVRHLVGAAISAFGDYFTLIAMPWLVLGLTRDPFALGVVMALESLPRAVFMLIGGGAIDRYTPLRVLLASRAVFMLGLFLLAALLWSGRLQVEWLYGFSLLFGVCAAFSMPAASALLPRLVEREAIQKANSALMGLQRLMQLIAPVLAGLLIWNVAAPVPVDAQAAAPGATSDARIALAIAVNAVAVAIAWWVQFSIRVAPQQGSAMSPPAVRLAEGFAHVLRDRGMTIAIAYVACVCFFAIGPLLTSIPQFAQQRLPEGALGYGVLYAANGLGSILGFAAGGLLPRPSLQRIGPTMLAADLVGGACVLWFAHSQSLAMAACALAMLGIGTSYGGVVAISWIQQRVPMRLAGRIMGLVMFSSMGLAPLSMALSGAVVAASSLQTLLTLSGTAIVAVTAIGLLLPSIRRFGTLPPPAG
jgi:MFS family permease